MSGNDNMERLNKISSAVSERDKKIWENAAYSICIRKNTEKLREEIARLRSATEERKNQKKILEEQLMELNNTLNIQRDTLQASQQSLIMQKSFKESLMQEANDFKKKYEKALEMYNEELQDYRSIYENASQGYKDLQTHQIHLQKLEIRNMDLDTKISSVEHSQKQFKDIQKLIFQKTIVKFAEFYILHHKSEELRKRIKERKREEQELLKEHLLLSEAVKQRRRLPPPTLVANKENHPPTVEEKTVKPAVKESDESVSEKMRKFLDQEILPCSLTSVNTSQRQLNFNQDGSKIQVMDVKIIRAPSFRKNAPSVRKPDIDLRKKMLNIMETTKKEALGSNSSQIRSKLTNATPPGSQDSQKSQNAQYDAKSQINERKASNSQKKTKQKTSQLSVKQPNEEKIDIGNGSQQNQNLSQQHIFGSQQSQNTSKPNPFAFPSTELDGNPPKLNVVNSEGEKPFKESILKPPSQTFPNPESEGTVSKFFSTKKKNVTFNPKANSCFQFFTAEKKKSGVTKMTDISMLNELSFNNEMISKLKENNHGLLGLESGPETSEMTHDASFTLETGPTFSTFSEYTDKNKSSENITFDPLEASFNRSFVQQNSNIAPVEESGPFAFFSQNKSSNPFSFF